MHYEIGERDNGIIDGEKIENAFFGWKLFTATAILHCEYSTASLRVLSCNYAAIIRPRCEKSIDGARNGSPLSFEIVRHPTNKISWSNLFMKHIQQNLFLCTVVTVVRRAKHGQFHYVFIMIHLLLTNLFTVIQTILNFIEFESSAVYSFHHFSSFCLQCNSVWNKLPRCTIFDRDIIKHMIHL